MAFTNARQSIPPLFQEIMVNHAAQDQLLDLRFCTFADAKRMRSLKVQMDDLRRAAEIALSWNHSKGTK